MLNDEWIDGDSPEAPNPDLRWRPKLAKWPDEWRERWGHRANDLEDSGMSWIEAERQAMNETMVLKRQAETAPPAAATKIKLPERSLFKESA